MAFYVDCLDKTEFSLCRISSRTLNLSLQWQQTTALLQYLGIKHSFAKEESGSSSLIV